MTDQAGPETRVALVTGPSGAGRTTAIRALEDLGWEVIDNLPLSMVARLAAWGPHPRPLALGIDVRNRDFTPDAMVALIEELSALRMLTLSVLYLDAAEDVLIRRYSETRRRHPAAPAEAPLVGIGREADLLTPVRARADVLIDTSTLSPHDLKAEIEGWFSLAEAPGFGVTLHSFSYKRGLPRGLDLVFDCRFLTNPYWEPALRPLDGRDPQVGSHIAADSSWPEFRERLEGLIEFLLPAYRGEGKPHLSVGFGCTGGQHRSVYVTETLAEALAASGWRVSKRHRELRSAAGA